MSAPRKPESWIGRNIGPHRITRHIASGGIGHVFEATNALRRDAYGLKLLRPELESSAAKARFNREAAATSKIRHENVLDVHGATEHDGELSFFTMELLRGLDLADTLHHQRALAPPRAVRIARAIARGLGAAHAVGVVHRDLKPENVFLVHASDGRELVKIIDFSSAWLDSDADALEEPTERGEPGRPKRLTLKTEGAIGTPEYMPPEQLQRRPGHPSADIYALGILLVEMISGRVPFSGASWQEVAEQHANRPLPRLAAVSEDLADLVEQMVQKRASNRFLSMRAVESALSRTLEAG